MNEFRTFWKKQREIIFHKITITIKWNSAYRIFSLCDHLLLDQKVHPSTMSLDNLIGYVSVVSGSLLHGFRWQDLRYWMSTG